MIGYPESRIILSQCAIYLATSVKSNASYMAIGEALDAVRKHGDCRCRFICAMHLPN